MPRMRAIGLLLLVGAFCPAQETAWRKTSPTQTGRGTGTIPAARAVRLALPTLPPPMAAPAASPFRQIRVRAQSPEDFTLPPELWPSTLGKEGPAKTLPPTSKGDADKAAFDIGELPSPKDGTDAGPAPAVFPGAPANLPEPAALTPAAAPPILNPWTGLPWGAVFSSPTDQGTATTEWLVPGWETTRPQHRFEAYGEYLLWWTKGSTYPVLVTTDSPFTPQDIQGVLPPRGNATPLFGGGQEDARFHSGARFGGTYWLGDDGTCGIEGSFFFLGTRSDRFRASSDQFLVLARPFFEVAALNDEEAELISTPGIAPGDAAASSGSVAINAPSRLSGFDLGLRWCLKSNECGFLHAIAGYRNLNLEEGLGIVENIVSFRAIQDTDVFNPGNRIIVSDLFETRNEFHGGYLGLKGEYRWQDFFVEGRARVSLGNTRQSSRIDGSFTAIFPNGQQRQFVGGLLALPTNIGVTSQNRFTVVPEVGLKVGYQCTDNLRVYMGYDFLYWNNVMRPADQIDRRLNALLIPNFVQNPPPNFQGPLLPRAPMRTTDYWAQGLSFGLEYRF